MPLGQTPLFLASSSPRRRRLLEAAGIEFQLAEPGPEPVGAGTPREVCALRARAKASGAHVPGQPVALVLGVDTVVDCDGVELGKPVDRAAARATLLRLLDREHLVHTAHCLLVRPGPRTLERLVTARVRCDALSPAAVEAYLDTADWTDKAGGYGIQSAASGFMTLVEGDLDTVIGLSIRAVRALLAEREAR